MPDFFSLEKAQCLSKEPVIPELLSPLKAQARQSLQERIRSKGWNLQSELILDLVRWYEQTLARLTNLVILQRFSSFHLVKNPLWRPKFALPGDAVEEAERDILDHYIAWEEIEKLLLEDGPYPELSRILQVAYSNWLDASIELLERVVIHQESIAQLANCASASLSSLTGVEFGISDPHMGGRTAAILKFGSNKKVVYKPRSLDGELSWGILSNQIMQESIGLANYPLTILAFNGYGFMEYVDHLPCSTIEQVRRCYKRYGVLLAVAHALGTCDLHHENIIVSGEYPVVIDAEPLFRARLAISEKGRNRLDFEKNLSLEGLEFRESILELGILPLAMQSLIQEEQEEEAERQQYDIGALCAYGQQPIQDRVPCGRGSNDLQMRAVSLVADHFPNLPNFEGLAQLPVDFSTDITEGFEVTHKYLLAHREKYIGLGGILENFFARKVRLLARATMDYAAILARSISPETLRSSERRRQLIESDLKGLALQRLDTIDQLADTELESLFSGDIPRFEVEACQTFCDANVELLSSPIEAARNRWLNIDSLDLQLQMNSLRESLKNRGKELANSVSRFTSQSDLEQHGLDIVSVIVKSVCSSHNNPYWVYVNYAPGYGSTMVHADREALYEGAAGTALVIAEAGRLAGESTWCQLATRVFDPVVNNEELSCLRRSGGLARGLGGLIYAMLRVSDASGEKTLLDSALHLALKYAPQMAQEDGLNEVLYGRAGLLLAVLALQKRCQNEKLLIVADTIADKLMSCAVRTQDGVYWPSPSAGPMPNVSHGNAGIAMALARYARLRDSVTAARVAHSALALENSFWLTDEKGWLDARVTEVKSEGRANWSWCNGRAGALLARLAVSESLGTSFEEGLTLDALNAKESDAIVQASPGLCCGTAGIIDALLQVQQFISHSQLSACLNKAINTLATSSPASHYSTLTASLFGGTAGLAFALLRAARPSEVRSILWFD